MRIHADERAAESARDVDGVRLKALEFHDVEKAAQALARLVDRVGPRLADTRTRLGGD